MFVVISDLHLTDGTSGGTLREHTLRVFKDELEDLAVKASFRRVECSTPTVVYEPIEEIDVLLLGDILDVIRSARWLDEAPEVRPWMALPDPRFTKVVGEITQAILAHNQGSIDLLRSLTRPGEVSVPVRAVEGGAVSEERVPVRVRLHYWVGNHDWFFHLGGPAYPDFEPIRRRVVEAMGLSNDPGLPFPHDPSEPAAAFAARRAAAHQVFARHGDIYDAFNFEGRRDASSLGDAIVIELLNRFPRAVTERLGELLSDDFKAGLRELDNVRPLLDIPSWIEGLLSRTCDAEVRGRVMEVWNGLVDAFLALPFVRAHDAWLRWDDVDSLAVALRFSHLVPVERLSGAAQWLKRLSGGEETLAAHAMREAPFRARTVRFVVYGHTHNYEVVPLDTVVRDHGLYPQMYLNSGTWRKVHVKTQGGVRPNTYQSYNVMTYLAFFHEGERHGRRFECWTGALG